jgi:hypothetical protein
VSPEQPEHEIVPPPVPWHSLQVQVGANLAFRVDALAPKVTTTGAAASGEGTATATPAKSVAMRTAMVAMARMFVVDGSSSK